MLEMERALHQLHAEARAKASTTVSQDHASKGDVATPQAGEGQELSRGLARVNSVAQGSPAAMAVS